MTLSTFTPLFSPLEQPIPLQTIAALAESLPAHRPVLLFVLMGAAIVCLTASFSLLAAAVYIH